MPDKTELMQALHEGAVSVTFVKADGHVRDMRCTLATNLLPVSVTEHAQVPPRKTTDENLIKVYDLEAQGWRSFKWDRLQTWHKGS